MKPDLRTGLPTRQVSVELPVCGVTITLRRLTLQQTFALPADSFLRLAGAFAAGAVDEFGQPLFTPEEAVEQLNGMAEEDFTVLSNAAASLAAPRVQAAEKN